MNHSQNKAQLESAISAGPIQIPRWKRALDITLVLMAFPLLVPLMAFIAILIRAVSTGPVLFKQERIGCAGKPFMCFKFRSMFVNADAGVHKGHLNQLMESDAPMVKMDAQGDPRVIPFGALLRSTGLDELPQIFNVLRGEMSIVGPRPCVMYEYENYLPWQQERFNTLPGLTGLWQVSGKNRTTFTEMIQLDIDYIHRKNLWLDLIIIFKTVPALVIQVQDLRKRRKLAAKHNGAESNGMSSNQTRPSLSKVAYVERTSGKNERCLNTEANIKNGVAI